MTDIRGYVEQVTREGVRGWAYDADASTRPVLVEILIDGRAVAVGPTDQPRPDLANPEVGRDTFGYTISLPEGLQIEMHRLSARVVGTTETLTVLDDAGRYEGFVEAFEGGSLKGWAWRCGYPEERVRVVVRHQGVVVGSSLANQPRPDLIGAGVGDGRHAFLIALPIVQKQLDPAKLYVEFEANGVPLTDLRYPDRAPPPPPIGGPALRPVAAAAPSPMQAAPRPAMPAPIKTPIAARPPMTRMPMARATKPPMPTPSAPVATIRPISKRPISAPPGAPPPAAQPVAQPVARAPEPPAPAPQAAPPPTAQPAPPASQPAAQPSPQPAPPPQFAPAPQSGISKELYEALRGSLHLGDEDGLF